MNDGLRSPLQLLASQPSHVLFVVNNARAGREASFLQWYRGAYKDRVQDHEIVVHARHFEQHEVDVTCGRHMLFPYKYLGLYHLSLDGAEQVEGFIDSIQSLFREREDAEAPATWLFYPISEKVGRPARPGS